MTLTAMPPVAEAVYGVLVVDTTLAALATGGVFGDVPEDPTYPFVWIELLGEEDRRGFGGGGLPQVDLRVHVFSLAAGLAEARAAMTRVVALLKDATLTVTGYALCGRVFYDETVALSDQELRGVKVHELVGMFRIYVEETP